MRQMISWVHALIYVFLYTIRLKCNIICTFIYEERTQENESLLSDNTISKTGKVKSWLLNFNILWSFNLLVWELMRKNNQMKDEATLRVLCLARNASRSKFVSILLPAASIFLQDLIFGSRSLINMSFDASDDSNRNIFALFKYLWN